MKGYNRCATCDEWYPPSRARQHEHWHPQGGPVRDRWIASRLHWDDFANRDPDGDAWDRERRPAWELPRRAVSMPGAAG